MAEAPGTNRLTEHSETSPPTLDILIPTYNRCGDLARNIELLDKLVVREMSGWTVRILVSNNASQDETSSVLHALEKVTHVPMTCFHQEKNLGGEPNVVFLLGRSNAQRVMIVGDDDFLPEGYLCKISKLLSESPSIQAVVPGIASLYPDGEVVNERNEPFDERRYPSGTSSVRAISYLGHQISGIVFRNDGMLEAYLKQEALRNIYPTVFFLGYSAERGDVCYLPAMKVLISQGNTKYWSYDASGLLSAMFLNYRILYPNAPFTRLWMCLTIMYRQPTRLGFGANPWSVIKGTSHLLFAPGVDPLVRLALLPVSALLYVRRIARYFLRKLHWLD